MADENTPEETPEETPETVDPGLGEAGQRALQRERDRVKAETKARKEAEKARTDLEARLREFEDRDKTELQKAAEAQAEADKKAADAMSELARMRVAIRHGITEDDMDLLGSGSDEEIERRAQRLAALKAASAPADLPPVKRPNERLRPGATPAESVPEEDPHAYPADWIPAELRTP